MKVELSAVYQRDQIPQNCGVDHADHGAAFVTGQLGVGATYCDHNAATAIHTCSFMGDDWENLSEFSRLFLTLIVARMPCLSPSIPAQPADAFGRQ
jgi:hypothetical protein